MASVSVIILTLNEEVNLPAALDSVKGWAENVFIVDSFGTDRTIEIAKERVVVRSAGDAEGQVDTHAVLRNWTFGWDLGGAF